MNGHKQGTSMVEYGLIGLLFTFCGVGLYALGINLQHLLEDSSQQTMSGNNTFMSQILGPPVVATTMQNPSSAAVTGNSSSSLSPAMPITPLTYSNNQSTSQSPLQLSGANGMTEQLASTLTTNANNLLATGEITQAQANLLIALSDQGHILAENQALFENALKNGQSSIVYHGKSYSLADFSDLLAFNTKTSSKQNWKVNPSLASPLLQPFAKLYQQVQQSGMLDNPKVQQQVGGIVTQIGAMADALGWSADDILGKKSTISLANAYATYQSNLIVHFQTNMEDAPVTVTASNVQSASGATNGHSITICNAGSGQDTGSTCKP